MKKFLVSFIVGVVFLAIGTTSIIFEINEFERVDVRTLIKDSNYFETEKIELKGNETISFVFDHGEYVPYSVQYDDALENEVHVSISNTIDYGRVDNRIMIYEANDDWNNGIHSLSFLMDGLKKHKIYDTDDSSIVITLAHKNRDRIDVQYTSEYN